MTHRLTLAAAVASVLLVSCQAGRQIPSMPAQVTSPETKAEVRSEPLAVDLAALVRATRGTDPAARAASIEKIGPCVQSIRGEFPDLSPLERRVGAAWNMEKRVGMQALLTSAFKQIESSLLAELGSADRPARLRALKVFEAFGEDARSVVPVLARMVMTVAESDIGSFRGAAEAIGGLERDFVPPLAAALGSSDAAVRRRAMAVMQELAFGTGWSTPSLAGAAGVLGTALSDPEEQIRDGAVSILSALGRAAAPARDALRQAATQTPTTYVGKQAAEALHAIDPHDVAAVPGLIAQLGASYHDWKSAADLLREIGPGARAALPKLVSLREGDDSRLSVLRAIAAIDLDGAVAIPVLIRAAAESDEDVAECAIEELVRFAARVPAALIWVSDAVAKVQGADAIVERFRRAPEDADARFQVFVALFDAAPSARSFGRALYHAGVDCRQAVSLLLKALDSPELDVHAAALRRVAIFGAEAAPALPRLRALMRGDRPEMRQAVTRAMVRIDPGGESILDDLIARLDDSDQGVRHEAIVALGRLGTRASRAAPALSRLSGVNDEYGDEREWARRALVRVGGDNRELVAEIVSHLLDAQMLPRLDWGVRWDATDLGLFEPPPLPSVEALIATLAREGQSPEALHALLVLERHGERSRPALPALAERLKSPVVNIRMAAAHAIGAIGPAALDVVPALCAALDAAAADERREDAAHGQADLVDAVIAALGAIGPDARAALPHIVMALGRTNHSAETALERIEPPHRPSLTVNLDPALTVCAGRWREATDGSAEPTLLPVGVKILCESDGRRIVVTAGEQGEGYEAVELFLRRGCDDRVDVTGDLAQWSMDTAGGHDPISFGTITFRTLVFGKGVPVQALLTFENHGTRYEIAFVCDDPFQEAR